MIEWFLLVLVFFGPASFGQNQPNPDRDDSDRRDEIWIPFRAVTLDAGVGKFSSDFSQEWDQTNIWALLGVVTPPAGAGLEGQTSLTLSGIETFQRIGYRGGGFLLGENRKDGASFGLKVIDWAQFRSNLGFELNQKRSVEGQSNSQFVDPTLGLTTPSLSESEFCAEVVPMVTGFAEAYAAIHLLPVLGSLNSKNQQCEVGPIVFASANPSLSLSTPPKFKGYSQENKVILVDPNTGQVVLNVPYNVTNPRPEAQVIDGTLQGAGGRQVSLNVRYGGGLGAKLTPLTSSNLRDAKLLSLKAGGVTQVWSSSFTQRTRLNTGKFFTAEYQSDKSRFTVDYVILKGIDRGLDSLDSSRDRYYSDPKEGRVQVLTCEYQGKNAVSDRFKFELIPVAKLTLSKSQEEQGAESPTIPTTNFTNNQVEVGFVVKFK